MTHNRLGVPVPRNKPQSHHLKNLAHLKDAFRKKHTNMPYKHQELKKTPFEIIEEESKVAFDVSKLTLGEKDAY